MILNKEKQKLSKRRDGEAVWIATYRKQGYLPEAMVNYLALLGWNPGDEREFFTLTELGKEFSLERVHKAGAIFDPAKLKFINAHYLRQLSDAQILQKLQEGNFIPQELIGSSDAQLLKWVAITRDRMETLGEFAEYVGPIARYEEYSTERLIFRKSDTERTKQALSAVVQKLEAVSDEHWQTKEALQKLLEEVVSETGLTNGDVFWSARVALSGLEASPSPAELLWTLGKEQALSRLRSAQARL